jgi:hypothetical protein
VRARRSGPARMLFDVASITASIATVAVPPIRKGDSPSRSTQRPAGAAIINERTPNEAAIKPTAAGSASSATARYDTIGRIPCVIAVSKRFTKSTRGNHARSHAACHASPRRTQLLAIRGRRSRALCHRAVQPPSTKSVEPVT